MICLSTSFMSLWQLTPPTASITSPTASSPAAGESGTMTPTVT